MSGVEYLLDTNILIGLLKGREDAVKALAGIAMSACGYSAVTRMELLGFPGITNEEEVAIQGVLGQMAHFGLSVEVEDAAIAIRREHRLKLPDAIIAATAKVYGLTLVTLDNKLASIR